jgi:hypothetical protein
MFSRVLRSAVSTPALRGQLRAAPRALATRRTMATHFLESHEYISVRIFVWV